MDANCTLQQRRRTESSPILELPEELRVEVATRVGSNSFRDLINFRMSCKTFLQDTQDNDVLQRVNFDDFPDVEWQDNEGAAHFMQRYRDSDNTDLNYKDGFQQFFAFQEANISGLQLIKKAAEMGHLRANYLYGMILLAYRDTDSVNEAMHHLNFIRKSKCISQCRYGVNEYKHTFWINTELMPQNVNPSCTRIDTCGGWNPIKDQWAPYHIYEDAYDPASCDTYRWDYELRTFYSMLNIG